MSYSNSLPLTPTQIKSGQFSILGVGLWSSVLDVGDGTALKLVRRRCAGMGDGLIKVQREVDVLQAIRKTDCQSNLDIAEVRGWGKHIGQDSTEKDEYDLWLQTTIVPGDVSTVAELEKMAGSEARLVGASIARAIADIHQTLCHTAPYLNLPTATESLQTIANEIREDSEGKHYARQLLDILNTLGGEPSFPIHGDFNLSNLLFKDDRVCSVVDFAETRQGFYEEDLAAIVADLPSYRDIIVKNFEAITEYSVIESRLNYGLAMKAFLSFIISRRLEKHAESNAAQRCLDKILTEIYDG